MKLADTIASMESEDFKERFIAEYQQLDIRLTKLNSAVSNMKDYERGTKKSTLLIKQAEIMKEYKEILIQRAVLLDIDLEIEKDFNWAMSQLKAGKIIYRLSDKDKKITLIDGQLKERCFNAEYSKLNFSYADITALDWRCE